LVNIASGLAENYVASNPTSGELTHPTLTYAPNVAPVVAITAPANGASVVAGNSLTISATATDSNGTVTSVEFFVDGVSVGVDATSPYSVSYTPTAGTDVITAVATDSDCASTTSASRTITATASTPGVPANDSFANATLVTGAVFPLCSSLNATLIGATESTESQITTPVGAGQDVWYRFVAQTQGVSIQVNGPDNLAIELLNSTGTTVLFTENQTSSGQEILVANNLTPGATYYIAVVDMNAPGSGNFSMCLQTLRSSTPNNGTTFTSLCSFIKASWTGAQLYTVSFSDGTNTYTASQTSTRIPFSLLPQLQYGTTYSVTFSNTFIIDGVTSIVTSASFNITIAAHPPVQLRAVDRCPTARTRGAFISTDVNICGHIEYEWEFLEVDVDNNVIGIEPIRVESNSTSRWLRVSQIPGVQDGDRYRVRIRPVFSYGAGTFTPGYQLLCVAGQAPINAPILEEGDVFAPSAVTAAERAFEVYPNPNAGDVFNVRLAGINSEVVIVRMLDAMGRVVYNNQFTVAGSLNTSIVMEEKLSSGMYMIQVIDGEETMNNRMIVR
jgi:hypothetical protein